MKLRYALLRFSAVGLAACSNDAKVSDVTVVRAYVVVCDSAQSGSICLGPTHKSGYLDYTVIISKNEVRTAFISDGFHDCQVQTPHNWNCLDAKNSFIWMHDGTTYDDVLMRQKKATVDKAQYCFADDQIGMKSSKWATLECLLF